MDDTQESPQPPPLRVPVERIPSDYVGQPDREYRAGAGSVESHRVPRLRPGIGLTALVLFLLTCASTFYSGMDMGVVGSESMSPDELWSRQLMNGLTYAVGVIAILGAHEMGHYLQARRYRIAASPPFFIPMPASPFGTMGAVILQQAGVANRRAMFDIAISGPLAGLVVALPLCIVALYNSVVVQLPPNVPVEVFGEPMILRWMAALVHGPLQAGQEIQLSPLLFAGWVGIFITGLNLIPIGQLDGGHILYCLMPKRAHAVARTLFTLALAAVIYGGLFVRPEYFGWTLMLLLLSVMGTRHPPTADDSVPLGRKRVILGWLTLAFIVIGFTPNPIYVTVYDPAAEVAAAVEESPQKLNYRDAETQRDHAKTRSHQEEFDAG